MATITAAGMLPPSSATALQQVTSARLSADSRAGEDQACATASTQGGGGGSSSGSGSGSGGAPSVGPHSAADRASGGVLPAPPSLLLAQAEAAQAQAEQARYLARYQQAQYPVQQQQQYLRCPPADTQGLPVLAGQAHQRLLLLQRQHQQQESTQLLALRGQPLRAPTGARAGKPSAAEAASALRGPLALRQAEALRQELEEGGSGGTSP
jgi:hypothetical protein